MKRLKIVLIVIASISAAILLYLGLTYVNGNHDQRDRSVLPRFLTITEILPSPGDEGFPWIELHNPKDEKVNASGLTIVIDDKDKFTYTIPEELPPVPAKGFVIFQLDGKGEMENSYEYTDRAVVLHSPQGFKGALNPAYGQIALYKTPGEMIGFVSWGQPGSKESSTPQRNQIWKPYWFVPIMPNFGDYDIGSKLKKGYSIGLYPGSKTNTPDDWGVYAPDEATFGKENVVPRPKMFTLPNGAVVRCEDVAFSWVGNKYAWKYKVQVALDKEFSKIKEEKEVKTSFYRPENVLPQKVYYYRVKIIDINDVESLWSKTREFESRGLNMENPVEEKILSAMIFKYQRKDTKLLCLDGCASERNPKSEKHWDNIHPARKPSEDDHGKLNCARASISMMVSFYGKRLSQDLIAYHNRKVPDKNGPQGDLGHRQPMLYRSGEIGETLKWALDKEAGKKIEFYNKDNTPAFQQLCTWLAGCRPIMTRIPGHVRTMNGYWVDDRGVQWVHILDPKTGPRWELYDQWKTSADGTWVGPAVAPNARQDEPGIWRDSDCDGIMDFDEKKRFKTDPDNPDSDGDGITDKDEIRAYVFNAKNEYARRNPDPDGDGLRNELDPDNKYSNLNNSNKNKIMDNKKKRAIKAIKQSKKQ